MNKYEKILLVAIILSMILLVIFSIFRNKITNTDIFNTKPNNPAPQNNYIPSPCFNNGIETPCKG